MRAVVVCCILACVSCRTADAAASSLEALGFSWGRTSTSRSFDDEASWSNTSTDPLWGWMIGAYADWTLPLAGFGLETELVHVEKGFSYDVVPEFPMDPSTIEVRDKYLSAALLLTRELGGVDTRPFVFAGPSFEFLRDAVTSAGDLRTWSAAVQVGVGVRLAEVLQARIRYVRDLRSAAGSGRRTVELVENHGIRLSGGLRFSL